MFDPDGSTGYLRASPFLRGWRELLYREVFVWAPDGTRGWTGFFGEHMTWNIILETYNKRFVVLYVLLRSITVSPKLG